jgi:hypothetical protein
MGNTVPVVAFPLKVQLVRAELGRKVTLFGFLHGVITRCFSPAPKHTISSSSSEASVSSSMLSSKREVTFFRNKIK